MHLLSECDALLLDLPDLHAHVVLLILSGGDFFLAETDHSLHIILHTFQLDVHVYHAIFYLPQLSLRVEFTSVDVTLDLLLFSFELVFGFSF